MQRVTNNKEINPSSIACTIGILTYNSEENIKRCLVSVRAFNDILIADGGSIDGTLICAKEYGARVVSQSNPGNPITDFSRERNILLDNVHNDWFFYLDSDEIMTEALALEIKRATEQDSFDAYRVRYKLVHAVTLEEYFYLRPVYQIRLCNIKKTGARFVKPMHEKLLLKDVSPERIGTIEALWLVPLDSQLSWKVYKGKVLARFPVLARQWNSKNPLLFLSKVLGVNILRIVKSIVRVVLARIVKPFALHVPLRYEMYRLYVPCVLIWHTTLRYCRLLRNGS